MPRLALERVTKRWGPAFAIPDASFSVDDGETLAMLGPSGCGKTTVLRIIAGLDRADGGRIRLGDRDITRAAPRERNIALVFADFALFPHLRVRANIGFGVRHDRPARVAEMAQRMRIAHVLERFPARLSGGERQRVAVARALATSPAALLFDEPFASLDAPLRALLRVELAELRAQTRLPAIFVTHDQDEALALGDRVLIMDGGRIVALDTPQALLEYPPTLFVARFLGRPPANVFEGTVEAGRFTARAHPAIACSGVAPGTCAIAVAPERVRVTAHGGVTGRVRLSETIGGRTYLTVAAGATTVVAVAPAPAARDTPVALEFDYTRVWTYDALGHRAG